MILLQGDKKKAGIPEAKKLLRKAEKLGMVELCLSMSNQLRGHYGNVGASEVMYKRYRQKVLQYQQAYLDSLKIETLFFDLITALKFEHSLADIESQLENLPSNSFWRYNFYRYLMLQIFQLIKGDQETALKLCNDAIEHFSNGYEIVPYICKWHFNIQSIQIFLKRKEYIKAEARISKALSMVKIKGCFNWHITLLYRAVSGFHSGKYKIALSAYRQAIQAPDRHGNREVNERWQVVRAWLEVLAKTGQLATGDNWRLYKFLNSVPILEKDKKVNNVGLIVVKLLHLLLDGKLAEYETEAAKINAYLYRNLKGQQNLRGRYMLRALEQLPKGHFYKTATLKRADKWLKKMAAVSVGVTPNVLEGELLPFEVVWDIMYSTLK